MPRSPGGYSNSPRGTEGGPEGGDPGEVRSSCINLTELDWIASFLLSPRYGTTTHWPGGEAAGGPPEPASGLGAAGAPHTESVADGAPAVQTRRYSAHPVRRSGGWGPDTRCPVRACIDKEASRYGQPAAAVGASEGICEGARIRGRV